MHVHAHYNLQLAAMGSNRDEIQEIAARRAAEVRRRLAAAGGQQVGDTEEDFFIKAAETTGHLDPEQQKEGLPHTHKSLPPPEEEPPIGDSHGGLLSVIA